MNWNTNLIQQIRAAKEKEKSEDRDNLLKLTSQSLYGEKIHYALELIQNAEDEAAKSITFIFNDRDVSIINDGKPFDKKDVWRICSVKTGGKKRKIGFFGIGFKSVFNITKKPQIISGEFNFEVENYVYPNVLTSIPENVKDYCSPAKGAIFILPYSSGLSSPKELIENFNLIDDKILLFMRELEELHFIDNTNKINWAIKKNIENGLISLQNTHTNQETKWKVFDRDIDVKDEKIVPKGKEGIGETRITIIFPTDSSAIEALRKSGVVYCYLPTKKRTDLPFLIQADFLPTIGRENISNESWNYWLMREFGNLAGDAIDEIKNDPLLGDFLYDFIPLPEEVQDELIKQLYNTFIEALKGKEIAKTSKGWIKPTDCIIPSDDRLRHILSETDLKLLLGKEVFYVDPGVSGRAKNVLFKLGAREIGPREVVDFLENEEALKKKDKAWFLGLHDYLSLVFDTSSRWNWAEDTKNLFEELEKTKFILTDDDSLVPLKDPAMPDRLICYPQNIDVAEIHQLFSEGEIVFLNRYFQESSIVHRKEENPEIEERRKRVKNWLDNIGVRKYFKQVHVIKDVILPKFSSGKYKNYDDLRLYKFADYIRIHWSTIETEIKNKKLSEDIIDDIKNTVLLRAFCHKGGSIFEEYRKAGEIYFSKRFGKNEVMEDLFEGIESIYFLSPYYLNREKREIKKIKRGRQKVEHTWRKFFDILGVWSSPVVVKEENWVSISGKKEYGWVKKQYSARGIHEIYGDDCSNDVEGLIEYCSKTNDQSEIKRRMVLLWESLEKNWKFYKEKGYCSIRYKWFDRTEYSKDYETSSFLEFLRNASWVPAEDGGFYKPNELFADTNKNRLLIGEDTGYVSLTANETFLKDLGIRIEPTIEEVINHLKVYRDKNPQPKESKIEKAGAIYAFFQDKLNSLIPEDKINEIQEIRKTFAEHELLYLPREDKIWWKPIHVFWKDFSESYETLRGYIEYKGTPVYDVAIKDFLSSLGVVAEPSFKECLMMLEDLKEKGDFDYYRRLAPRIYTYINSLVKRDIKKETDWNKPVFLSEKGQFLSPPELYFSDNNEYKKYFGTKIEILWLPFSWVNIRNMLLIAEFRSLTRNVSVIKKIEDLKEIDGETTNQIVQRLLYVEGYLKKNNAELHRELQKGNVFKKIRGLQAYETTKIILDYGLTVDNQEPTVVNDVEKRAYFSNDENRIYTLDQIYLFSTPVAKELSKLFFPEEEYVLPILDSLFNVRDEDELNEKLEHFNIQVEDTLTEEEIQEEVKLRPYVKEEPTKEQETAREEEKPEVSEEISGRPQLPVSEIEIKDFGLINPDEFIFARIEEHEPYTKSEGIQNAIVRTVELKKGTPGAHRVERETRKRAGREDAETTALEIAMRLEELEDRESEDRHKQKGIGHDIHSKTKDGNEMFIEVKHFRGEAGSFELKPHQWKKAEQEGDKYFVYIISGLKKGNKPKLEIIQDPVKYLMPDPPAEKKFSDWKNGVAKAIDLQKV